MHLKAVLLCALVGTALAGPLRSDSRCARECTDESNLRYENGLTYKYRYSTTSSSLINGTSDDQSGFQINADVEIEVLSKCDMSLNLRNVRIEEVSPSDEMLNSDRVEFFRRTLEEKPLAFSFQDGEIPEICPDMEEPSWALNIKRGILSHFQSSYFRKQEKSAIETDVTGSCPTKFIVERGYYGSQTIRKSKDFMGCSDRHHIESAIQSSIYDPRAPTQSLVSSSQNCDQVIEDDRVKSVACKESHISRPFANHENGALTKIRTTLEFYDIARRTSSAYKLESQVQTRKTLLFDHKPKTETESEDESRVEEVLDEICRTVRDDVRPETAEQFTKLVFRMRKLKSNSLGNIHRHIQEGRICNYQKEKIEKFFMDAIPMMSTTAAVTFMTEKISSEEIKGVDADMWLLSLSFITHPTKEMIKEVRELVQYSNPRRSTYLAISSMIHKYCESEERDCLKDDEITSTLRLFEENLGWKCSARNTDDEEKILLSLKALGNSGQISRATNVLTRCFQEEDNSIEIRLAAIEAFRRMPCEVEGREEQMKMLEDIKGNTEVRIAAYLAVMKCPTPKVLKRIHAVLEKEEINQVGSFMWSHLKGLNSTSDPLKQDIRKMLEDTKLIRNYNKDPRKFSRAFEGSLFSEDMNLGGTVENHLIFSPESWIPRSGMMNLTAQVFGYSINLFEFGGRIEGFDYLLEKFFGPKGYFPDNNLLEMVKAPEMEARQKRSAIKPSKLENLHNRFDAKQPNSPKGSMYMKMFGNELSSVDFQKIDWLKPEKESVNLLEMLIKLSKEQTKEFTKNMILMESSFDTPTIIGLPLNLAVNSTASMNLKVSGKADLRKVMVSPRSLNITGAIRPSAVIEVSSEMSLSAFVARSGLRMVTRMHSSTALDGSISLDSSETFKVKFNVPDNRLDIIDVSNKLYLVNAEFPMEIAGITENYRQHSKCTGHIVEKWAGVRLCGELRYPNASQKLDTPYFPLTGPVSMKVTLDKVDPTLSSYEMEAKYQVQRKRVNAKTEISDVLRFMIGTPGTHMPRTHSVDVVLNRAQKALSVDLVSLDKKVFIQTKMVNESDIKRLELNVNYNNMMQYTTSAEVVIDRDENSNLVKYMPTIEVRLPNRIGMTLSGTFSHEPERKLEADVTYNGIGGKSRFIGKVLNETDMKSLALSVSYNDGTPYTLEAEVGVDRGYQQIRFRPSVAVSFNERNMRMFGAITHQTDRSLDIDMTLRGVREDDMSLTANIVGEKWRSLNTAITLKGIKTEDITFSSAIRNDMWKSLNVDMSLTGLTARPISFSSDIEGEKWSRLKVESRLGGVRENEIVFTSTITGEKWRRLNVDMALKGVREDDLVLICDVTANKWYSLDGSIALKGIRERDISFVANMENQPWTRHDSTFTLKGVREQDIVLQTTVSGEKGRNLDGMMTLRGVKSNDITLSTRLRGEYMSFFEGSVTLAGIRKEEMSLSTTLRGEMGKEFYGTVNLKGIRRNPMTLTTSLSGEPWKKFEGDIEFTEVNKKSMRLRTVINGEKWTHLDGSIILTGVKENEISLTTNIDNDPWRSLNGHITLRGVKESDISLTAAMNGDYMRSFNSRFLLRGIKERDINLDTSISTDKESRLNAEVTLRGIKEREISLSTDITGAKWRSLNANLALKGVTERDLSVNTKVEAEKWRRLDTDLTISGIREHDIVFSSKINGEKWRSLNANLALKGVTERDLSLDTKVEAEKWRRLDTDLTISGIRERDIVFSSKINGEKWRSLNVDMSLSGAHESTFSLQHGLTMEWMRSLEASLRMHGLGKMLEIEHKLVNNEALKRFELDINVNNEKRYTTNAEVAIDVRNEMVQYLPTFEVHLPENKNLILRGSVGYQPKRAIDIYFTLSRSGAVEMTLEGNFLNENNEKFNTAVTFTHSKINLAIRDIFQHTREILGSDLEIEYTLAGKATQTMRFSDTIRNKTTEVKHSYEYDSSMFLSQWPQYNFEGQLAVSGAARREGSVDLTVCYGERTCQDDDKKITFSINMKNESNVYVNKASAAMAVAHKGSDLDFSMDMSHENTDHFLQTQASMNYKPGRRCGMLVELRNNTRDLKKLTGEIRINCLSSEISLTQDFEEVRPKNYKSDTVLQLDSNTKYSIEAEYNNNTDEFKFDHDGKVVLKSPESSIVLQGNGFRDEKKMNGEVEFKYAPSRIISFSAEYKNKSNKRRNSREATVRFDTPFRLFRDMQLTASLDNTDVLYESEVTLQYAPSKTVSMQGRYQNAGDEALSRHEVEVSFNIPRREIHIFTYVQNSSREYELGSQFKLMPEFGDKKELTFALGYGNYTDNTKLHHEVSMEVSTNSRNILAEFGVEKSERGFVTETLLRWSPEKQMIFTVNLDNKSSRRQTEFDVSVNFNHPSRQVILELHHENTTGHINSKVDLSWEPTSKMTTELNYNKRRADDKDEHTTRFTITHPQKTMILSFNLAKNERMFSNEFEMVLDGKSQLKLGSEYHNETDSRKLKHDIIVDFESDMVSEDPVHFEFHVDKMEWDMSMESKLTYQRDQEIELEMSHTVPHKTENSQRNEVNFKLDTPLENSHPLTTIEVEGSWERNYDNNDATHHAEVELQWGRKRRSQRVSMQAEYERKIDGDRKEHSVEMKVKHPVELPLIPREPEMKVKLVSTPNSKESKVTYQWSDDVDPAVIETVYRNYTTSSKVHHLLDVIVKHPNLEEDIHLTTETKLFNGPTLLNTMVSLIYSTDKQKTLFFRAKAMNKSDESELRYAFETELRHLYNNIDFVLESQMGNTKQKTDGRFEMTYKGKEKYNSVKFNGEVNKKDKSFYVKADMPIKTIEMTGKFENRSTAEHTIYYMTLDNKYDGWKEVHSSIDINTQERLFEVTIHHNSERPEDYMRLTAQFLNRTAVEVRAHRNILGEMITDALIYARLNTSEILHTRIHWRPQMPREVKEFTLKAIEKMNHTLRVELVQALKEKYWEMKYSVQDEIRRLKQESDALREWEKDLNKLGEELKKKAMEVYDDMKPEYKETLEKMKQKIQDKYEEIRTDITKKYKEFQEQQLKEMKETLKQKWDEVKEQAIEYYDEEIRPVWNEIKDAFEVVADLARKDFEDIKEFWMEKYDELKAILEEHTETLRQKLEDLKAKFDELYEDMKEKMGELKADAALKLKEYRQKWEVTKARMVNATTQAMKAMEAKWNETRELAMKQWEEYKAMAEKMYEEYKAIVMEKWEEYKTKSLEKYEEYKAIVMKKYEEYRAIAMKKWEEARDKALKMWEDAKTKALAKWEEYKEEYKPQIEDLKRRYENVREVIKKRYEEAKEKLEEYLDDIKSKFEDQYREILSMREVQEIMEMKALKDVPQIVVEEAKWAWNYWQVENSTKELYHRSINTTMRLIRELKEELKSKYILFEPENGNIFITIPLPLKQHSFDTLPDIRGTHLEMFYNVDVMDMYYRYKPSMDVWDWIPPHKSHAMVAGLQHYMTFDKKFYEFAGACSYIVARDFIDGNFSVVVNYDRDSDEPIKNSLTVISQDREIEIQPDFEVKMDDTTVELPIQHRNTTITREGSTIRVHNTNGVTVICNLPRDVCTVEVSGWYFHKTAGLAGTYNNEPSDDFLTSDGSVADNAENLARSWEVGKQCSDHRNRIRNCDNISESPRAEMCNKLFMNDASPLRKCFGVVDPLAFREMCLNDLCNGNEVDTEELPCNSAAAYVSECKMRGVPMYMPKTCVSCEKPNGGIFHKHENIKLTSTKDNVPKSADVVVIVEEKKCNEEVARELSDFVRQLDSEFKSQGLQDNRYGLIGFGGEGVHSEVHSHTIDSKLFNKARKFLLGSDSLIFSEAETAKNNDTFNAIRAATEYPFRTGVAKSIVLLACNDCGKSRFHYDEIINLLRDQGISLHVMTDNGFKIKKSSVVIYGVDAKTVFTSKDVDNPFGTKDLREFVRGPDNQCTRLAMASNGTVFDAGRMHEKSFSGVFCPRMVFTTKPSPCQICECVENVYGMGSSICRPCEEPTPIRPVKLQPSISSSSLEVKSSKEVIKAELKNTKFDAWFKKQKQ
ncbi:uncharacterized protein [Ptychodera flava]|uniref:uncharacterized protein n=1 Tax=Ptychodera flava TaxID=63121 RepID=UPI00396A2713